MADRTFPDPVISVCLAASTRGEQEKLGHALREMAQFDPSMRLSDDRESGQTILHGMSELHLEIIIERLRVEFGVEANVSRPQIAYRETITRPASHLYTHVKTVSGCTQYAAVRIEFEPLKRGHGFEFVDKSVDTAIPREFAPAVEHGIRMQKEEGVLAGFPTVDFRATLIDGGYSNADSTTVAFEAAARACFSEGILQAGPILLEPVMEVGVVTPENYLGDCIGDLNRRRGRILEQLDRGTNLAVLAHVPLSEMFGYIGDLRSMTSGRATFAMEFSRYEAVPHDIAD